MASTETSSENTYCMLLRSIYRAAGDTIIMLVEKCLSVVKLAFTV